MRRGGCAINKKSRSELARPKPNAVVRSVSCEPILEAVDFSPWITKLDWIIAGAESGPRARPSELDW